MPDNVPTFKLLFLLLYRTHHALKLVCLKRENWDCEWEQQRQKQHNKWSEYHQRKKRKKLFAADYSSKFEQIKLIICFLCLRPPFDWHCIKKREHIQKKFSRGAIHYCEDFSRKRITNRYFIFFYWFEIVMRKSDSVGIKLSTLIWSFEQTLFRLAVLHFRTILRVCIFFGRAISDSCNRIVHLAGVWHLSYSQEAHSQ